MTRSTFGKTVLSGVVAAILVSPAFGARILNESFVYADGATVNGQAGGFGWSAPWVANTTALVASPGFSTPGVDSAGNRATLGSSASATRSVDATVTGAQTPGSTMWLSVMAQVTAPVNGGDRFEALSLVNGTTEVMNIRKGVNQSNWALGITAGNTLFQQTTVDASALARLVMRIDFKSGNEAVYLFVNPDPATEPAIETADASRTASNFTFNQIKFADGSNAAGGVDEFRIGTTYADLTAVPEPISLSVLGLGCTLLLSRRRKV